MRIIEFFPWELPWDGPILLRDGCRVFQYHVVNRWPIVRAFDERTQFRTALQICSFGSNSCPKQPLSLTTAVHRVRGDGGRLRWSNMSVLLKQGVG